MTNPPMTPERAALVRLDDVQLAVEGAFIAWAGTLPAGAFTHAEGAAFIERVDTALAALRAAQEPEGETPTAKTGADYSESMHNHHRSLEQIAALSAGWDEYGSTGPRKPLCWETVGRMALDIARSSLAPPASPGPTPEGRETPLTKAEIAYQPPAPPPAARETPAAPSLTGRERTAQLAVLWEVFGAQWSASLMRQDVLRVIQAKIAELRGQTDGR